jgi:superfamily II DNA/RNA helicase
VKALEELKFSDPTEIQRVSIPVSVYGKCDILGAAPTGSGKTLGEEIVDKYLIKHSKQTYF